MYPAHDVATLLAGSIVLPNPPGGSPITLSYAADGNLLVGPVRPVANTVGQLGVFVLQTGGRQPLPYMGQDESFHVSRVQVTVRSQVNAFAEGEALARALHAKAHTHAPAGYTYCLASESEPLYLGTDEENAHRFTFNLDLAHRR